ncbi:putative 3-ketoacyl-CoA reductase [Naematelia encephala]|uniref:Putative 3-ketoacyl-CoA reductase n=1 Tax=Naematelia encephala TaxID=71784 RepID=A0A1Y2AJY6_9TREE|nr:putative 3-ketoacyl-CoA reductase [Naematelia encephala]
MVADTIHLQTSSGLVHPSVNVLGYEIVVDLPIHTLILSAIGGAFVLRYAYSWLKLLAELTIIPGINVKSFQSRKTSTWALVTGCTSGLGLEFARQLAAKKYNIVLLGRRQEALDDLAKEIESKYGVQTKTVLVDMAQAESRSTAFAQVEALGKELDFGVLINNAGVSHEMPVTFAETPLAEIDNIVQTNFLGTFHLTRVVLPFMIARSKSGPKSLILNIGSMDGRVPPTLLAVYGATKGGLSVFSKALAEEVRGQRVLVNAVTPAFVISNMSKIRKSSLTVPTAKVFVHATLTSIGLARGAQGRPYEMTPFWAHAFMDYFVSLFGYASEMAGIKIVDYVHKDLRRRVLRKRARDAAKGKQE